jgi:hypothetical protein
VTPASACARVYVAVLEDGVLVVEYDESLATVRQHATTPGGCRRQAGPGTDEAYTRPIHHKIFDSASRRAPSARGRYWWRGKQIGLERPAVYPQQPRRHGGFFPALMANPYRPETAASL